MRVTAPPRAHGSLQQFSLVVMGPGFRQDDD
jgi:hypothetical protein